MLCTKPVCAQAHGHTFSDLQRMAENAETDRTIVTTVKHDAQTFWHSSHWEVRSASGWAGDFLDQYNTWKWCFVISKMSKSRPENAMVAFTQFSRDLCSRGERNISPTTLTLPRWRGRWEVLCLTAPVELPANGYCQLPATWMGHVG